MKKIYAIAVVLLAVNLASAQAPQAKVEQGLLEGIVLPSGVQSFRGIPFAEPPVGSLRWKAPLPAKKWKGVRKADTFGNYPMQKPVYGDMKFRAQKMSEDCLYLNVWTTAKKGDKLPVLVYFYGGGFVAGDGSENRYDGESLAEKGIVTVTLNYRLGVFGFFSHPELTKESPKKASGNYGLLDQNAALLWVKKNIAAFGGDPDKITIAGESAGSISVSAHMASPLSKNLIAGAIGQSGAMIYPTLAPIPLSEAEAIGAAFAKNPKAGSIATLRAVSAEELLEAASLPGAFSARAVIDGYFLPKAPVDVFAAGEQAQVPLLAGWTSTEMPYMAFMQGQYPNVENYIARVNETFGESADRILKLYPVQTEKDVVAAATALASDGFIAYSTWKWLKIHRLTTKQPVYAYIFSRPRPLSKIEYKNLLALQNTMPEPMSGTAHAAEIEYVLGNLESNKDHPWEPEDHKVSMLAEEYFANFIKTGNPNAERLPRWDASTPDSTLILMNLNVEAKAAEELYRERYEFLDEYYNRKYKERK